MASERYKRKVFKDVIEEAIIEAILSGELKFGDRVIEMEWAEKFGSSQAPVREAIRDLEGRGVLETKPFKGASVRVIGKEELCEVHSIRAGLETVALTKVIQDVSDDDVKRLKKALDEMMEAAEAGDTRMFIDKDIEFHEIIVDLANMPYLKKLWDMCNVRVWTTYSTKYSQKDMIDLAKNHEAIYKKMENRDYTELFETITRHFLNVSISIPE